MSNKKLIFQDKTEQGWLDEKVFTQLFQQYWEKLFGFCRHHIHDVESAKEIVQQVFLSLWERRGSLEIQVNVGHYLFSAVRLQIAHYFREQVYQKRLQASLTHDFCDLTNNTEETIHFEDLHRQVDGFVDKLPDRCQEVYTLSRKKGMSLPEIAGKLGIAEKTAEAHLTKALKYLRSEIQAMEE